MIDVIVVEEVSKKVL